MAAGDAFSAAQRADLAQVVRAAADWAGLPLVLHVGALPDGRGTAVAIHGATAEPDRTVLIAVDPGGRTLEIVTGATAAQRCDARACALAAVTMTTSFGAGDLLGGIRNGVQLLADRAHQPHLVHTDTL